MIWLWLPGSLWVMTLVAGFVLHRPAKRKQAPRVDYVKISRLEQQLGIGPLPPNSEYGLDDLGFPVFKPKPAPAPKRPNDTIFGGYSGIVNAMLGGLGPSPQTREMVKPDQRCAFCIPGRGPVAPNFCPFFPGCQA